MAAVFSEPQKHLEKSKIRTEYPLISIGLVIFVSWHCACLVFEKSSL